MLTKGTSLIELCVMMRLFSIFTAQKRSLSPYIATEHTQGASATKKLEV